MILAHSRLKMKDFINLKIGDVITTEQKINAEIEMKVGNRLKFFCRPGLHGKRRAAQIMSLNPVLGKE